LKFGTKGLTPRNPKQLAPQYMRSSATLVMEGENLNATVISNNLKKTEAL